MSISYKTVDAIKRILLAIGPNKYEIKHIGRIKNDPEDGRRLFGTHHAGRKLITIYKHAGNLDAIDTVLHELLHAAFPDESEEEILTRTKEIGEELWNASA